MARLSEKEIKSGHCLCGAVRWRYHGAINWAGHCHCASCRRNCAAPVTSYIGVPRVQFEWLGKTPKVFVSNPGIKRYFCADCGTPMAYETSDLPDEIHLYAASLSNPEADAPEFQAHFHFDEHLPWLPYSDGLPKHTG